MARGSTVPSQVFTTSVSGTAAEYTATASMAGDLVVLEPVDVWKRLEYAANALYLAALDYKRAWA
jgi:hypothetical protein